VIAAVSVVFPWSMCPIVPTFTCGFERSNFSFAITLLELSDNLKFVASANLLITRQPLARQLKFAGQL
jgi:hypothetical protein